MRFGEPDIGLEIQEVVLRLPFVAQPEALALHLVQCPLLRRPKKDAGGEGLSEFAVIAHKARLQRLTVAEAHCPLDQEGFRVLGGVRHLLTRFDRREDDLVGIGVAARKVVALPAPRIGGGNLEAVVAIGTGQTAEPVVLGENVVAAVNQTGVRTGALATVLKGRETRVHCIAAKPAAQAEAHLAAFLHKIVRPKQADVDDARRRASGIRSATGPHRDLHAADQFRIDIGALIRPEIPLIAGALLLGALDHGAHAVESLGAADVHVDRGAVVAGTGQHARHLPEDIPRGRRLDAVDLLAGDIGRRPGRHEGQIRRIGSQPPLDRDRPELRRPALQFARRLGLHSLERHGVGAGEAVPKSAAGQQARERLFRRHASGNRLGGEAGEKGGIGRHLQIALITENGQGAGQRLRRNIEVARLRLDKRRLFGRLALEALGQDGLRSRAECQGDGRAAQKPGPSPPTASYPPNTPYRHMQRPPRNRKPGLNANGYRSHTPHMHDGRAREIFT